MLPNLSVDKKIISRKSEGLGPIGPIGDPVGEPDQAPKRSVRSPDQLDRKILRSSDLAQGSEGVSPFFGRALASLCSSRGVLSSVYSFLPSYALALSRLG